MSMTDPIADMLTRIRNANTMRHDRTIVPSSKMKKSIAAILQEEGFIKGFEVTSDDKQGVIHISMKYGENKERVISGLKRISKPGLRVYAGKEDIPRVLGGMGIAILSTSSGIITDKKARADGVGGEVLCYIW